jgi:hypothetical protein
MKQLTKQQQNLWNEFLNFINDKNFKLYEAFLYMKSDNKNPMRINFFLGETDSVLDVWIKQLTYSIPGILFNTNTGIRVNNFEIQTREVTNIDFNHLQLNNLFSIETNLTDDYKNKFYQEFLEKMIDRSQKEQYCWSLFNQQKFIFGENNFAKSQIILKKIFQKYNNIKNIYKNIENRFGINIKMDEIQNVYSFLLEINNNQQEIKNFCIVLLKNQRNKINAQNVEKIIHFLQNHFEINEINECKSFIPYLEEKIKEDNIVEYSEHKITIYLNLKRISEKIINYKEYKMIEELKNIQKFFQKKYQFIYSDGEMINNKDKRYIFHYELESNMIDRKEHIEKNIKNIFIQLIQEKKRGIPLTLENIEKIVLNIELNQKIKKNDTVTMIKGKI